MLKSEIDVNVVLPLLPVSLGVIGTVTIEHGFALLMGLSLRMAYNAHRKSLSWTDSCIRLVCAIGVSYGILILQRYLFEQSSPIFAIFISSMISLEIVIITVELSKTSFREWFRGKIKQFIGTNNE